MDTRVLPHDLDAERAVLGAIFIDNALFPAAAAIVQPDDFFRTAHQQIYKCIRGLIERDTVADFLTAKESLERNGLLEDIGGPAYLAGLVDGIPGSINVRKYAAIVKEKALHRRNISEAGRMLDEAYEEDRPAAELARATIERLTVIEAGGDKAGDQPVLVTLSDVQPEAIDWLWKGYLAFGKLTILSGNPGLGKSFITMDWAGRASSGRPWPDGSRALPPMTVLLLAAEDGLADTLRPRLDASGADVSRIHVLTGIKHGAAERGPQLIDVAAIEKAVIATGARLLMIDPVSSYLGEADSHKDAQVRALLTPLVTMAERNRCAVLGVMHLTKDGGKTAIYRTSGSVAFVAQARVALMVTSDPDNPKRRVLGAAKINIAEMPPCLAYTLAGGKLEWDKAPLVGFNMDQALAASSSSGSGKDEQTDAESVIRELLADDAVWPMDAKDAISQGEGHGIHQRTMQRTAKAMGIRIARTGFGKGGRWVWNRPITIGDSRDDNSPETETVSGMAPMQDQAAITHHTHIDDINSPFPRARENSEVRKGGSYVEL